MQIKVCFFSDDDDDDLKRLHRVCDGVGFVRKLNIKKKVL